MNKAPPGTAQAAFEKIISGDTIQAAIEKIISGDNTGCC